MRPVTACHCCILVFACRLAACGCVSELPVHRVRFHIALCCIGLTWLKAAESGGAPGGAPGQVSISESPTMSRVVPKFRDFRGLGGLQGSKDMPFVPIANRKPHTLLLDHEKALAFGRLQTRDSHVAFLRLPLRSSRAPHRHACARRCESRIRLACGRFRAETCLKLAGHRGGALRFSP